MVLNVLLPKSPGRSSRPSASGVAQREQNGLSINSQRLLCLAGAHHLLHAGLRPTVVQRGACQRNRLCKITRLFGGDQRRSRIQQHNIALGAVQRAVEDAADRRYVVVDAAAEQFLTIRPR